MRSAWLRLYHALPGSLRFATITLRGLQLELRRYGPETEKLVDEASARESWGTGRWQGYLEERVARLLYRAATAVPYYRALWEERRRRGDRRSYEMLGNWPVLQKATVRARGQEFIAEDRHVQSLFREQTSGTTGAALSVWSSRETLRAWYSLFEARVRRWNGVSRDDRWAMLGGQLVISVSRREPPFWVWNGPMQQLYCSSYHLTAANARKYLDALRKYDVHYLVGYASAMATLAHSLSLEGLRQPLAVAISNAEPLLAFQRERIGRTFQCAVRDTYGMAEMVCSASECHAGGLHIWPEAGIIEIVHDDRNEPVSAGVTGRLVATGLLNPDMPLIRYETGDRGAVLEAESPCGCGRSLPRLSALEGRMDDVIITPDGARVGRLDPVFKDDLPLREAQIEQESLERLRVRVVPLEGWQRNNEVALIQRVQERVGSRMEVIVETVPAIERTATGKFRSVVSRLPRELVYPDDEASRGMARR